MRTPFLDLKRQHNEVETEIEDAFGRVLRSGRYILDREVEAFEDEWARFCGVRRAAGTNSGTDSITLALLASGAVRPGKGDEVITSPLTAGYTAIGILNAGAVPIFSDVDPKTLTLDPDALEGSITASTRAILPVHLYGQLADMARISKVASRHGLVVIEDAAQAHGASAEGRLAGSLGHAAAFSFYPTKNLGACGDGGIVTSDDEDLIERVKQLRQGGHPSPLQSEMAGMNSRLDEVQAAILRVKLKRLADWNQRRREIAAAYLEAFAGSRVEPIALSAAQSHVFHLFVVQHPERERLRRHLASREIETMIHYPFLLHEQQLFRREGTPMFPNAERAARNILSLPLYPQMRTDEVAAVIDAVMEFESSPSGPT